MRLFPAVLLNLAILCSALAGQEPAWEVAVPGGPAQVNRHSTFLATFDDPELEGAQFAALEKGFGGQRYKYCDDGRHGGARGQDSSRA